MDSQILKEIHTANRIMQIEEMGAETENVFQTATATDRELEEDID